jgi:hypothetical protein
MNHPEEILGIRSGVQVAHSVPVTVAAETGTLGLFFYYLVVVMVFLTNVRSARIFRGTDPPFWRYLALSLNYGLLGFLVTGIFLSTAYYPFLWYQAGLTASLYGIAQRERSLQAQAPRPAVARTRPGASGGLARAGLGAGPHPVGRDFHKERQPECTDLGI